MKKVAPCECSGLRGKVMNTKRRLSEKDLQAEAAAAKLRDQKAKDAVRRYLAEQKAAKCKQQVER